MDARLALSAHSLAALTRGFQQAPAVAERELTAAATEATMLLEREVKDTWPTGVFNSRQQIASDVFSTPAGVLGVVGTPSVYALVIEDGRRPGKGVSKEGREALAMWAVGILGVTPKEAPGVAFLISRKIKAKGIAAKHPFQNALQKHEPHVLRMFEDACGRVASHLAGGSAGGGVPA
jgi:hypothetical protein